MPSRLILKWTLALALSLSPAFVAAAGAAPTRASIDRNGVLLLIRTTLIALDQANKTGNYSVLRDLGAPHFQASTPARLAMIFLDQRRTALDLSGVAVIEPQLSVLPEIGDNGLMHLAGFFPSVPTQVNFDLYFAPIDQQWRLFDLAVQVGTATPTAPAAQANVTAAPAAAPAQPQKPAPTSAPVAKTAAKPQPKPHTPFSAPSRAAPAAAE